LPIAFGLSSGQIIALALPRFFAVYLPVGDLTALDNANRLMQIPVAIFAAGPAIALYPTLSLLWSQNRESELRTEIASALRRTLFLMLMATALLLALRESIIHLLLEHGQFDREDTLLTARVLFAYTFGLIGLGAQQFFGAAGGDDRTFARRRLRAHGADFVSLWHRPADRCL
jgi:putative peptidoglycan lipid II flippase